LKDLKLQPSYTVALNSGGRRILGELEANMLKSIDETGSFSQAARSLGLSYPFLWNTISQIEKSLNRKIVMSERGGAKGGRAVLTGEGKRLLRAYTALDSRVNRFLKGEVPREEYLPPAGHVRPNLSLVGSHCIVVEKILRVLHESKPRMTYQMVNVGSWAGLTAIMLRDADIAGIHIFDEEKGRYNEPLLSKYGLSHTCTLIRGYRRQQSLMVRKGNPKEIIGISDLLRKDVKLANRNPGSGTRMLLDRKLLQLAKDRVIGLDALTGRIRGYDSEMMTHRQVAEAVASRRADVGLGLTSVATEMKLGFIPIAEEWYDFLAEKRRRNPDVRAFFAILASRNFQNQVRATTSGITFSAETGQAVP
jgi:putative molybdopterin biosynthesis protein